MNAKEYLYSRDPYSRYLYRHEVNEQKSRRKVGMHGSARSAWNAIFISGLTARAHPVGGLESFPASPGSGPAGVWKPSTSGRIASAAGRFRLSPEAIMAHPTVLVQTQRHEGVHHHARGGLQDIRQDVQDIRRTRSCAGAPKLGFRVYRL